jgi:hypothetical protein
MCGCGSYVLRAVDRPAGRNYVQPAGSAKSYGSKAKARRFASRAEAEADACGNETPEPI